MIARRGALLSVRLLSMLLLLAACAAEPDLRMDAGGAEAGVGARIELGGGRLTFEPLEGSPAELELISGPQGGWHLDLTLRLYEIARERLELEYRVERVRDALILCRTPIVVTSAGLVQREDPPRLERLADRAVLDIGASADVIGEILRVRATLRLADGRSVVDERDVLVVDRVDEL